MASFPAFPGAKRASLAPAVQQTYPPVFEHPSNQLGGAMLGAFVSMIGFLAGALAGLLVNAAVQMILYGFSAIRWTEPRTPLIAFAFVGMVAGYLTPVYAVIPPTPGRVSFVYVLSTVVWFSMVILTVFCVVSYQ